MHAQVFPDFSVKQAFRELQIERADDIIISSIQSDLTTRCLTSLLKAAIVNCVHSKRKYISEKDIHYAKQVCIFPRSQRKSCDLGYILDTRQFGTMCTAHIDLITDMLHKYGIEAVSIKISGDSLIKLQEETEQRIRGFMEFYAKEGKDAVYGYRLFDRCMSKILGEPQEESSFTVVNG